MYSGASDMDLEKQYFNCDDVPRNILQMVKGNPEWAPNIIQWYEKKVAKLDAQIAEDKFSDKF